MKKLERLLEKLAKALNLGDMEAIEFIIVVLALLTMVLFEGIGIWMAVEMQVYLILSIGTLIWVFMILNCFVNKIFFKKLDNYLSKTPKATILVFSIFCIISMTLSFNYFIGFILTTILAFMLGDFENNKENKKKE